MADLKITGLTEITSTETGDLVEVVDVSDTTFSAEGTNKKVQRANLIPNASTTVQGKVELATNAETLTGTDTERAVTPDDMAYMGIKTGWLPTADTWTYASATTFTISGVDRTSIFTKGTKLKLTNDSATKYFYVVSSAFSTDTTVTVTGETDLANSAITNPFYSYNDCPQGFKRGQDWYKILGEIPSDQTISDATWTTLDFEATSDPNGDFTDATNLYTVPITGYYQIAANFKFDNGGAAWTRATGWILKNGSVTNLLKGADYGGSAYGTALAGMLYLAKGDTIAVQGFVDVASGSPVVDAIASNFSIQFIGP